MREKLVQAIESADAVLDNVQAVRGEKFADVVRMMVNVESLARVAAAHGAPIEVVATGYVAVMRMMAGIMGLDEGEVRELQNLVDTVHGQLKRCE